MNKYKFMYWLTLTAWVAVIAWLLIVPVGSSELEPEPEETTVEDMKLEAVLAISDVNAEAQEPVTYEDWFRANAEVIDDCAITHYCVEKYEHICGEGHGMTYTGVPVTAGWTCAVDASVIPYGSEVMVDYGDHVEFYKAQDKGGAIKGNHIDLAVETHDLAEQLGTLTATVYFMEVEREFN